VVTALNALIGYWGFNSAKEISAIHEKAKNEYKGIKQVMEDSYYYQSRDLEREIVDLVKDLPSIELRGAKTEKTKKEVERIFKSLCSLQETISPEKQTKVCFLAEGFLCFFNGNYDGAIAKINQYNEEIPEKYLLLAQLYRKLRNKERAQDALARVAALTRVSCASIIRGKALNTQANLESDFGNHEEAIQLYKKALKHDPGFYVIHYNCAAVYSLLRRYDDSIKSLCQFNELHDGDIIREIETDPDNDFSNLIRHLGDNWERKLRDRLSSCPD
jgi:tetratricopeptide (TPR) repeat protein